MKERIKHLILFIILIGIDQGSKLWVRMVLANRDPIIIIPKVLNLQYQTNTGAAWSIMSGKGDFLKIFTIIILAVILYLYFKIPEGRRYNALKLLAVFIVAGAVGNLIDRFYLGYVVDFIYFEIINFPLFNFADSCLTVSSVLLFLFALFYYKDADFAFIDQAFKRKHKDEAVMQDENSQGNADVKDMGTEDRTAEDKPTDKESADKESID